jgi:hypothetical protein
MTKKERAVVINCLNEIKDDYTFNSNPKTSEACALEAAIEELKELEDQRHKLFRIGETLVDESKYHITSDEAVEKIREIMRG